MLIWPLDIVVASSDSTFQDPVVSMGVNGVEWFAHSFELGPRKAKEFLFTSDVWTADEAHRLGMVNHVVKREELHSFCQNMARKIALKPAFALKLAKESVNQASDMAGQSNAINAAFSIHHIAHRWVLNEWGAICEIGGTSGSFPDSIRTSSHNKIKFGMLVDPGYAASSGLAPVMGTEKM
jgi:enoyl-CoA hydratase